MGAKLLPGVAAFNETLNSYKYRAKKKNIEFCLTTEQFKEITSKNCIYCGKEPSQDLNRPHSNPKYKHSLRFNGSYLYNGIDRKNCSLGYTLDNCVTCCGACNLIKNDILSHDEMLVVMKALIEYRNINYGKYHS